MSIEKTVEESWLFDLRAARRELAAMDDKTLHALFVRHLNYVTNSPLVRPAMQELERRGL